MMNFPHTRIHIKLSKRMVNEHCVKSNLRFGIIDHDRPIRDLITYHMPAASLLHDWRVQCYTAVGLLTRVRYHCNVIIQVNNFLLLVHSRLK